MKNSTSQIRFYSIFFFLVWVSTLSFAEESDSFPEQIILDKKVLSLNGVGVRKATLFAIKVYEAGFYADRSIHSLADALSAPPPKRLDIRYSRTFSLKDTQDAWRYQFRESAGIKPGELGTELEMLIRFQSEIQKGTVQRFDFLEAKTLFFINGELQGEIPGLSFQTALLTLFFGPNPPTHDLQKGLMRGIRIKPETAL